MSSTLTGDYADRTSKSGKVRINRKNDSEDCQSGGFYFCFRKILSVVLRVSATFLCMQCFGF